MKNLIRIFLLLIIGCVGIGIGGACSDEAACSMSGRPMMYCTFYTKVDDNVKKDTLDSLTITARGTDSIILNNEKKVSTLMLPLRYASDTTVFIFHYDRKRNPTNVDTLYIMHHNTPYFQSMECGYMMKQNITKARFGNPPKSMEQEKIDSLFLKNTEANANKTQNLQIFFRYRDRNPPIE